MRDEPVVHETNGALFEENAFLQELPTASNFAAPPRPAFVVERSHKRFVIMHRALIDALSPSSSDTHAVLAPRLEERRRKLPALPDFKDLRRVPLCTELEAFLVDLLALDDAWVRAIERESSTTAVGLGAQPENGSNGSGRGGLVGAAVNSVGFGVSSLMGLGSTLLGGQGNFTSSETAPSGTPRQRTGTQETAALLKAHHVLMDFLNAPVP